VGATRSNCTRTLQCMKISLCMLWVPWCVP
jgi:hypothetical protein